MSWAQERENAIVAKEQQEKAENAKREAEADERYRLKLAKEQARAREKQEQMNREIAAQRQAWAKRRSHQARILERASELIQLYQPDQLLNDINQAIFTNTARLIPTTRVMDVSKNGVQLALDQDDGYLTYPKGDGDELNHTRVVSTLITGTHETSSQEHYFDYHYEDRLRNDPDSFQNFVERNESLFPEYQKTRTVYAYSLTGITIGYALKGLYCKEISMYLPHGLPEAVNVAQNDVLRKTRPGEKDFIRGMDDMEQLKDRLFTLAHAQSRQYGFQLLQQSSPKPKKRWFDIF